MVMCCYHLKVYYLPSLHCYYNASNILDKTKTQIALFLHGLDNSDHNMLTWTIDIVQLHHTKRSTYDYKHANYEEIRKGLLDTRWSEILIGDTNNKWLKFKNSKTGL